MMQSAAIRYSIFKENDKKNDGFQAAVFLELLSTAAVYLVTADFNFTLIVFLSFALVDCLYLLYTEKQRNFCVEKQYLQHTTDLHA